MYSIQTCFCTYLCIDEQLSPSKKQQDRSKNPNFFREQIIESDQDEVNNNLKNCSIVSTQKAYQILKPNKTSKNLKPHHRNNKQNKSATE